MIMHILKFKIFPNQNWYLKTIVTKLLIQWCSYAQLGIRYLDDDRLDEEMLKKEIVIHSLLRIINISNLHQCQIPVLQMC